MTAEAPPPTSTPSGPPPTPKPTNTPRPTDTPIPTATPIPMLALPFTDDFNDGLDPAWTVTQGNALIDDGRLTASTDRLYIRLDDKLPESYAIDFDYDNLSVYEPLWIIFSNRLLFFATTWEAGWKIYDSGKWDRMSDFTEPDFDQFSGHARLEVSGNRYTLYINGFPADELIYGQQLNDSLTISILEGDFIDNFTITPN